MNARPSRPWLRFSLRALLVAITVFCLWLGWETSTVRTRLAKRKEAQNKGFTFTTAEEYRIAYENPNLRQWLVEEYAGEPKRLSFIRRRLGDEAIQTFFYHPVLGHSKEDAVQYSRYFPEAKVFEGRALVHYAP